jgi:TusA-related sulfurtransferase
MATKTWKLGELARGGVITVTTTKNTVLVQAKEWDFSKGTRRGSDQSQAKEFNRLEVSLTDSGAERKVDNFLNELTTSYYSSVVLDWIKTKVTFNKNNWDF